MFHRWMFMSRIVVHDDMDVQLGRHIVINMVQEFEKLAMPVSGQAAFDHFSAKRIESGKER